MFWKLIRKNTTGQCSLNEILPKLLAKEPGISHRISELKTFKPQDMNQWV